jgi:hypothetical protein
MAVAVALVTLVFNAMQNRKRAKQLKFQNYLHAMSQFLDLSKMMVERPELHAIYDYSDQDLTKPYKAFSPEEKSRIFYCDALLSVLETVWLAGEEGWLSKDEWPYWLNWARQLYQSADFRWNLQWNWDDYDNTFLHLVANDMPDISRPHSNWISWLYPRKLRTVKRKRKKGRKKKELPDRS